jgi:hypothetical protein
MFKNIKGFTVESFPQQYVDERFQYFQHYWSIVRQSNRHIFFDEVWFESHRSIITKIENQFQHTPKKQSYKWFQHFFLKHPFFNKANIIARKLSILIYSNKIHKCIDPTGSTSNSQKENNYVLHFDKIKVYIQKIKFKLLEKQDYNEVLANLLTNILSDNQPLSEKTKADIRFLVNAFIVELYTYGYSLEYIEKIPDIIIFRGANYEFPYEKTLEDFDDDIEKYKAYKIQEQQNHTLEKCFLGLVNLINRPYKDGYYIFKVENILLQNPNPIVIGDVTFYNPNKISMLNLSTANEAWKTRLVEAELFYSPMQGEENDVTKRSSCNAIIKAKIKTHENIESPVELHHAYNTILKSVEILHSILKNYISVEGMPLIHFHRHIKLHENKKIANYSLGIFNKGIMKIDIDVSEDMAEIMSYMKFINSINNENKELGSKLFHIISTLSKLKINDYAFNFKDIWIAWEALLKKDEMISLAKELYLGRYKENYIFNILNFLNLKLSTHNMYFSPKYWTLNNKELEKFGLFFKKYTIQKNHKLKFLKKYQSLNSIVPIEIVKEIISRVDEFTNYEPAFYQKLSNWIENTINEVYIERNHEVHKNLKNDLSTVKLKEDFLRISIDLTYAIIKFGKKSNSFNMDLVKKRIIDHNNKL